MMMKRIKAIEFRILSPEQIRKMSAIEIKSPETYDKDGFPMEGGFMDNHLGVINPGLRCKTCGNTMKKCPGHFGHIELVRPVVHSEFGKRLEVLMQATCQHCGRIAIPDDKLEQLRAYIGDDTIDIPKKILARGKKAKKCPHCSGERKLVTLDKPTNFYIDKDRIYPTQIREWMEKVPDKDLEFFGYESGKLRPEWFVLTVLQVPPINLRPSITLDSGIKSEDDLTHKLVDIIRINMRLKDNIDAGAPQLIIEDLWDLLQYHVTTYFNNNTAGVPPAKHRSGRALRTLVQRLQGKKGRFRYNLTGKRVNFAARSIITPDPMISINELGVPREIAENMTVPETVTKNTVDDAKALVKDGKVIYVMRPDGIRKKVTEQNKEDIIKEIDTGYRAERKLHNGDIVLFNRQPSLHRLSMMAHRARIMEGKTFRLNPIVCVSGDTRVMLESGTQTTIEELGKSWENEQVRNCTIETGGMSRTPLVRFWKVKPEELGKKCLEITTETGTVVKVTGDHPLYSENGKVAAEELKEGERLIIKPVDTPLLDESAAEIYSLQDLEKADFGKTHKKSLLAKIQKLGLASLKMDDYRARIFARLLGHIFGDGTFIMKGHVARAIFRGEEKDLGNIAEDIRRLGFEPEHIKEHKTVSKIMSADGKEATVIGRGLDFEVRNKPLCALLSILGAPNGDKVKIPTGVPAWIMKSGKAIKREFVAAYFGSELSAPSQREKQKSSFRTPAFKMAKIRKEHALPFISGIESMLIEFGVNIASVSQERGNLRKDGTMSTIFVVKLSATHESLVNLFGKIGFVFSERKETLSGLAYQYLKIKGSAIDRRKGQFALVHSLRKKKVKFAEISRMTGISAPMLEQCVYDRKNAGLAIGYTSFEEWKEEATKGLGNGGLVWDTIKSIKETKLAEVYDITTQAHAHNFFANGILSGNCKPYNADFDGDEMNMHVPQTPEGIAEASELMIVERQIISPRYGAPVIIFDEDGVSGCFILTMKQTKFTKDRAFKFFQIIGLEEAPKPDMGKDTYSGKLIFSQLLPKDLNMEYKTRFYNHVKNLDPNHPALKEPYENDLIVKIENGVLKSGVIDSMSLGEGKGKLVDALARDYPPHILTNFYDRISKIVTSLISEVGMTVSLEEYTSSSKAMKVREKAVEEMREHVQEIVKKFHKGNLETLPGRTYLESFEIQMMRAAAGAKEKVQKQIMKETVESIMTDKPDFHSNIMILSGSRGSILNLTNLSGMWGQASVREGRPKRGYRNRLIALNKRNDVGIDAGGFIYHNFMEGMSPKEYFYHTMGGRQGEVDTGVSTKVSGYLYRRLANSLKDLVVNNDSTVRTANKNIIQYKYGEDGVFPQKTFKGRSISVKRELEKLKSSK